MVLFEHINVTHVGVFSPIRGFDQIVHITQFPFDSLCTNLSSSPVIPYPQAVAWYLAVGHLVLGRRERKNNFLFLKKKILKMIFYFEKLPDSLCCIHLP